MVEKDDTKCVIIKGAQANVGARTLLINICEEFRKKEPILVVTLKNENKMVSDCFGLTNVSDEAHQIIHKIRLSSQMMRSYLGTPMQNLSYLELMRSQIFNKECFAGLLQNLSDIFSYIFILLGSGEGFSEISCANISIVVDDVASIAGQDVQKKLTNKNGILVVNKFTGSHDRQKADEENLHNRVFYLPLVDSKYINMDFNNGVIRQISENQDYHKVILNICDEIISCNSIETDSYAETTFLEALKIDEYRKMILSEIASNAEIADLLKSSDLIVQNRETLKNKIIEISLTQLRLLGVTAKDAQGQVFQSVIDYTLGLGPIEKYLNDDDVNEIMVNSEDDIYVEKSGGIVKADCSFKSRDNLISVIDRIVAPIGRRIDESSPVVDARLSDGSRVHIIIPPLALKGPTLTIRKFKKEVLSVDDLIRNLTLDKDLSMFLQMCVQKKANILVSGGTGSGKTTMLNVLSSFISESERIITIEDSAELKMLQPHVVRLESRPSNLEGKGEITIRDLVKASLRMRPDRIIVGECRGAEALDMLQAMNTGHSGSLTTIHANNPRDSISRLETLVLFSGFDLPVKAIREQITSAINFIIQMQRDSKGIRRIMSVSEITGMEGDVVTMQELYRFNQGEFVQSIMRAQFFDSQCAGRCA